MPIPLGVWDTKAKTYGQLQFERQRGTALDTAGQAIGHATQQQYQSLDMTRRKLETQFGRQEEQTRLRQEEIYRHPRGPKQRADVQARRREEVQRQLQAERKLSVQLDRQEMVEALREPRVPGTTADIRIQELRGAQRRRQEAARGIPQEEPSLYDITGIAPVYRQVEQRVFEPGEAVGGRAVETYPELFFSPSAIPPVRKKLQEYGLLSEEAGGVFQPKQSITQAKKIPKDVQVATRSAVGGKKEQQELRVRLAELGIGSRIIGGFLLDPTNLIPIVGFTKADDFARAFRAIRAGGRAYRESEQGQRLVGALRAITRGEIGGTRLTSEIYEEQRALKTLVQEGRATPEQEARLLEIRQQIAEAQRSQRGGSSLAGRFASESDDYILARLNAFAEDAGRVGRFQGSVADMSPVQAERYLKLREEGMELADEARARGLLTEENLQRFTGMTLVEPHQVGIREYASMSDRQLDDIIDATKRGLAEAEARKEQITRNIPEDKYSPRRFEAEFDVALLYESRLADATAEKARRLAGIDEPSYRERLRQYLVELYKRGVSEERGGSRLGFLKPDDEAGQPLVAATAAAKAQVGTGGKGPDIADIGEMLAQQGENRRRVGQEFRPELGAGGQPPSRPPGPPAPPVGPTPEEPFEPLLGIEEPPRGPIALRPEEQDQVGEALTRLSGVPDEVVVIKTQRNLPTLQAFTEQHQTAASATKDAKIRLANLRDLAKDRLVSQTAIDRASDLANQARKEAANSKKALQSARLRFAQQDVVEEALRVSGDEDAAQIVGQSVKDFDKLEPATEALLTAPQWRQHIARVVGAIRGTPVGAVGRIAEQAQNISESLHRITTEIHHPVYRRVQQGLSKYRDQIQYVGPKEWSEIALGPYRDFHIIQHPEWWSGIPKSLANDMQEAQRLMRKRFDFMVSLGYPADALETAYLEQLWDLPRAALESRVPRARGKVSVTRQRLFADYAEGLKRGFTPRKDMTVQDLMEHSNALLDTAIHDAFIRQQVLRRFGSKTKNLKLGIRPFNHPLYRGYNAKGEVVAWVDQLYNPPGQMLRSAQQLAGAMKNTAFGFTDVAVGGVHFPLALSQNGFGLAVGSLNRALEFMGLPHFVAYFHDPEVVGRMSQAVSQGGVHAGIGPASIHLKGGTIVKFIPFIGKTLDKPLAAASDELARLQFGMALGAVRLRMYEGNLIMLKMIGENTADPRVRHLAGEWANASTGASRGALTPGRRAAESVALTSFQMGRSQLAVLGSIAKGLGPKASRGERLRSAMTLANFAAWVYGIQYLVNKQFGDGPMEWVPGKRDWATIKVRGQTVPIVPNVSLLRAMERSVEYLASGQEEDIPRAWAQLAVGRASPLVQAPLSLAGFGFEPGTGKFRPGTLSQKGRITGVAPIPPLVETAAFKTQEPEALAMSAAGFNPFQPSALSEMQDIPQYKGVDNDTVRDIMGDNGFLDRVSKIRLELIQSGVPQEKVQSIPTTKLISFLAEKEGKDKEYTSWAIILSRPTLRRQKLNADWLNFVVDNEDRLRQEAPWLFDQELEEFLRRVHLKEAK